MTDDFFKFILETNKENFTNSQKEIFSDKDYNPYSNDLEVLEEFLSTQQFDKAVAFNNINLLLSPRAHFYKNYALEKLGKEKDAQSELVFAHKIMEGICTTGDGTEENPYLVTRISDERDILSYLSEEKESQMLVQKDGKYFDLLNCKSGKAIYFDITTPYTKMQELMDSGKISLFGSEEAEEDASASNKKWWQFWK
ncbi:DUF4919 domain-containing protein [Winogradskyella tangerina]|uniref:DUF4919 domain-containing protein n=1 Tax=Winogradskyella tangerina TaxID=2023240 RepID=UPI000DBE257F|nr:DUF4919 domain-containing protein [Winogradskyella tangerina]